MAVYRATLTSRLSGSVMVQVRRGTTQHSNALGRRVLKRAKATCPVRRGHLRDSHELVEAVVGGRPAILKVKATYAGYVLLGTVRQPPNPWLIEAMLEEISRFKREKVTFVKL